MRLMILNGPNLNLLGVREPHIYGSTTLAPIQASCEEFAIFESAQLSFHQSNHEGVLVDLIQSARENADAIIINPAGYTFISIAILEALKAFEGPIFEVTSGGTLLDFNPPNYREFLKTQRAKLADRSNRR